MFDTFFSGFWLGFYFLLVLSFPWISKYVSPIYYIMLCGTTLGVVFLNFLAQAELVYLYDMSFSWISSNLTASFGTIPLSISFYVNSLSLSFSLLVLLIGTATNCYLLTYFKGEADEGLFIFWLNSFIASMLVLVLANNFFTLFLGWELIGLTSFFLINFWSARRATLKSSFKAFIFNLFSDVCLLCALASLYYLTGSDDCQTVFYLAVYSDLYQHNLFQLAILCLIFSCCIKSVQLIGHLWLPDSMEAPVPASSLIHSATLVSAGIYILCKFSYLVELSVWSNYIVALGGLTAVYGGLVAAAQTDVKKLLAYSTMSHCGFLWVLASLGQFYILILYLFLHGIFKAATFYCVGTFIRVFGTQDTRWMGCGLKLLSANSIVLLICSANLCGLPFTIGYLYKFFFFKLLYTNVNSVFILSCLFVAAQTSLIYFYRLNFYLLFDFYKNVRGITLNYITSTRVKFSSYTSFIRINHIASVSILLLGSVLFSSLFKFMLTYMPDTNLFHLESNYLSAIVNVESLYSYYYIAFYSVYLMIVYHFITSSNKASSTSLYVQTTFLYFLGSLIFIKFICELTS